jgi:hypothetical protein
MSFESLLVLGLVLLALSGVALLNALVESRPPRVAAMVVVIAGGLILWAVLKTAHPLGWEDIPRAFVSVVAGFLS